MRRVLFASIVLVAPAAYAYVDPGAGSMLLQLLLGGVAGLLVLLRLLRHRIASFFKTKRGGDPQ